MQVQSIVSLSSRIWKFSNHYPQLLLILWALPLFIIQSPQQSLMAHDEGFYAYQAKQIVEGGNWLRPGDDFNYDRAIGIQWIVAICFHLFGQEEWSSRLPSMFGAVCTLLLTYRIGSKLLKPSFALVGTLIMSVTPLWLQYSHLCTQDMMLLTVELLGVWAFLEGENDSKHRPLWAALGASTFGLGFWIKGFMIIPVALAFIPYLVLAQRRHHYLTTPTFYVGGILGLIPATLWIILSIQSYGLLPLQGLFGKLFILSEETFNGNGPLFYLWNIPANSTPWFLWTLIGGVMAFQKFNKARKRSLPTDHHTRYPWILFGYPLFLLLELTLFKTRTRYYALQLTPFFSLIAAIGLAEATKFFHSRSLPYWLARLSCAWGCFSFLLVLLGCALIFLTYFGMLDPALYPFGLVALGLGIGWLGIPLAQFFIQRLSESDHVLSMGRLWAGSWLFGAWLGLVLVGATGIWGNYNPKLKTFLEQMAIQEILTLHKIKIVQLPVQASVNDHKNNLLLKFYIRHLDAQQLTLTDLKPSDYAFIPPGVENPSHYYQEIGSVQGWRFVKIAQDYPILKKSSLDLIN